MAMYIIINHMILSEDIENNIEQPEMYDTHCDAGAIADGETVTYPALRTAAACKRAIITLLPIGIPANAGFPMLRIDVPIANTALKQYVWPFNP